MIALLVKVPMLHIEPTQIHLLIPKPNLKGGDPMLFVHMIGFALMLAFIDVIEQVMREKGEWLKF